jgi:hypothetical protein
VAGDGFDPTCSVCAAWSASRAAAWALALSSSCRHFSCHLHCSGRPKQCESRRVTAAGCARCRRHEPALALTLRFAITLSRGRMGNRREERGAGAVSWAKPARARRGRMVCTGSGPYGIR